MAEERRGNEAERVDIVEYLNHILAEMKEQRYVKAALDLQALVFALSTGGKPKMEDIADREKHSQLN